MSLLHGDDTEAPTGSLDGEAGADEGSPSFAGLPETVLALAIREWPRLRLQQGLGLSPTVQAFVYALSRQTFLGSADRRRVGQLLGELPKALLLLDTPLAQAPALWTRLPAAADVPTLARGLRDLAGAPDAEALQAAALRQAAAMVEALGRQPAFRGEASAALPPGGLAAIARALAWGALRASLTRGVSLPATACVAALREMLALLGREAAGPGRGRPRQRGAGERC